MRGPPRACASPPHEVEFFDDSKSGIVSKKGMVDHSKKEVALASARKNRVARKKEFLNHCKNDLEKHAHTLSGDAENRLWE